MERARLNPPSSAVLAVRSLNRNATGSAFAAAAISSMNDSAAKVACGRRGGPLSHQLSDQHGISIVVTEVIIVGGLSVVLDCNEVTLGIQPSAHLECECRALGIPRRLLVSHPLHSNRAADLFGNEC